MGSEGRTHTDIHTIWEWGVQSHIGALWVQKVRKVGRAGNKAAIRIFAFCTFLGS